MIRLVAENSISREYLLDNGPVYKCSSKGLSNMAAKQVLN